MKSGTSRAVVLAIGAVMLSAGAATSPAQTQVTVAGFGGLVLDAEVEALLADAGKAGASIRKDRHGGWAGIKAHLLTGAPGWDIISIGSARCETAAQMDLILPIDYSVVDKTAFPTSLAKPKYVQIYPFSYGIVYQKSKYGSNPPKGWADFWDQKTFPGKRTWDGEGLYALEAALIVDGVSPKKVYDVLRTPAGVERAFARLAQLKPAISVWSSSVGQAMQLVHDGEVDMAMMSNGRVLALSEDKVNVGFVWNQAFIDYECYMIPKNASNPKLAMQLINGAMTPKNQAQFAKLVKYGPAVPKAFELGIITPDIMQWIPTAPQNIANQVLVDPQWYASPEADAVYQRFAKFKQQ
jgi:putative spermidine/putrescine transport system substrate-binding protein